MATDPAEELKDLDSTLSSIEAVVDLPRLRKELVELNEQAAAPDLWDDQEQRAGGHSRLSLRAERDQRVEACAAAWTTSSVIFELAEDEGDAATLAEAETELAALRRRSASSRSARCSPATYDVREALVTIRSEAGGVDAADFAEMLMRMYLRWAERHGYPDRGLRHLLRGRGRHQVGDVRGQGAVRLRHARRSSRARTASCGSARSTTRAAARPRFAGVEVVPVVEQTDHIEIPENDIRIDVFRSSGPGGQSVNTTDSAVRITHIPTGIVVSCQNEKSQIQNRAAAMRVLQARLLERRRQEERAKMDALKGDNAGSWGNQMRSYVLHPYQMVKDLRTELRDRQHVAVLDGEIDEFIEAGVRWRKQQQSAA